MNKNTSILCSGAAGFMCSHIINKLIELGYTNVYGCDDLSGGFMRNVNPKSKFTKIDLSDPIKTEKYIDRIKPEIIFHLAASAHEGVSSFSPRLISQKNYEAFINLITPAIKNGLKNFVCFSSMAIYGSQKPPFSEKLKPAPVDIYGGNKALMENAVSILSDVHGFNYSIIRPHNVMGISQSLSDPWRNVVAIFMNRIMRDEPLFLYGDGNQKRSFSGIEYSLDCYIHALNLNKEIVNIGGKYPTTINRLADIVCEAMGAPYGYKRVYLKDRPREVKYAFSTYKKSVDLLGYNEPKDGWIQSVFKMAEWAKSMGPQPWKKHSLELINEKTPVTWLDNFNPNKFK